MNRHFGLMIGSILLLLPMLFVWGCDPAEPDEEVDAEGEPIIIGSPLPTEFSYGWVAERGIELAAEEINEAGGVDVGGVMRPLQVEVMDTRDLEPGVPVSDALMTVERLILDREADFIVGGPARTEALLPSLDLYNEHEILHISSTGSFSPASNEMVAEDYDTYKYHFKTTLWTYTMLGDFQDVFDYLMEEHGFDKSAVMVQDVHHARQAGEIVFAQMEDAGWAAPIIDNVYSLEFEHWYLNEDDTLEPFDLPFDSRNHPKPKAIIIEITLKLIDRRTADRWMQTEQRPDQRDIYTFNTQVYIRNIDRPR